MVKPMPVVGLVALLAGGLSCDLDPVHDEAIADLGPEVAGVAPSALHRAGQPCLVCHDGSTATPAMSVGGTVLGVLGEAAPLEGATVSLTDAQGSIVTATTNAAGNFFLESGAFTLAYPLRATVTLGTVTATMNSIIGRDGSCASCHVDPASRISAGHVYLVPSASLLPAAASADTDGGP